MLRPSHLLSAALAAVAVGCTVDTGDSTVLVLGNMQPMSMCTFTPALNSQFISGGTLDISADRAAGHTTVQRGYLFGPLLENDAVADTSNQALVARRTFTIGGAHVDITFNDTNEFSSAAQQTLHDMGLTHFDALFAGTIEPNGGLGVFTFELVPAALIDKILTDHPPAMPYVPFAPVGMTAKVVIYGTLGGGNVESHAFNYPITVCDTCLLDNVGPCAALKTGFVARTGGLCESNQDGVTDCCTDATGAQVCPAVAPTTGP
jgi:hypothetical protein